ncbi:hypothetical protein DMENIID0001_108350 [Sergentomyia squamirostris]
MGLVRGYLISHSMSLSDKSRVVRFSVAGSVGGLPDKVTSHSPMCNGRGCVQSCIDVPFVDSYVYLGLTIDRALSWRLHAESMSGVIRPIVSRVYQVGRLCPPTVLRGMYFACIESRLRYGVTVWGSATDAALLPVVRAQRAMLRAIIRKRRRESIFYDFSLLGIFPLKLLYQFKVLSLFYRRGGYGGYRRATSTRDGIQLTLPLPRLEVFRRSFFYMAPKLFNALPAELRGLDLSHGSWCIPGISAGASMLGSGGGSASPAGYLIVECVGIAFLALNKDFES